MDSRQARYFLRHESGDRRGERVALEEGVTRVGRRTANTLVLADSSVSGSHAEIRVQGGRAVVVDLGSTNGTRVDSERISEECVLAHGDGLVFGNVRFTFLDDLLVSESRPPATAAPPELEDALERVSAERIAKAGRRSMRAVVLLALAAAVLGVALWRLGPGGQEGSVATPVAAVEGNLLADGSFEDERAPVDWEASGEAPASLEIGRGFAKSGRAGLGAELANGEWTLSRSAPFPIEARRSLSVACAAWAEKGSRAVLGVELASSSERGPAFTAWTPALSHTAGFETVELAFEPPQGYDRGRLVLVAWGAGEGTVSFDDVHALSTSAASPGAVFNEYEARVLGDPGATAIVLRSGRLVVSGLGTFRVGDDGPFGYDGCRWEVAATERGFAFRAPGLPEDAVLRLDLVLPAREEGDSASGWISSIGPGGYRAYASELDEREIEKLLVGGGLDLFSIDLGTPRAVRGSVDGASLALEIELAGQEGFDLQLTFGEERAQASHLRRDAEDAERDDRPGAALAAWQELLDRHPYEASLVRVAETRRARLIQAGLERLEALRQETERARFFDLAELFREVRSRALALADRYEPSEVAQEARLLADAIDGEISRIVGQRDAELGSRAAVAEVLEREGAEGLAAHLRAELARRTDEDSKPGEDR